VGVSIKVPYGESSITASNSGVNWSTNIEMIDVILCSHFQERGFHTIESKILMVVGVLTRLIWGVRKNSLMLVTLKALIFKTQKYIQISFLEKD
jgi:hypothetical protein